MKKSHSATKVELVAPPVTRFARQHVIKAFQMMGYLDDFNGVHVTVLRNTVFPFQRITVPNRPQLSLEILKAYARDANFELEPFLNKLRRLQG